MTRLMDAIEKVGTGRYGSPRAFLDGRAAYVQQLVGGWKSGWRDPAHLTYAMQSISTRRPSPGSPAA